jgi:hypothetical protein
MWTELSCRNNCAADTAKLRPRPLIDPISAKGTNFAIGTPNLSSMLQPAESKNRPSLYDVADFTLQRSQFLGNIDIIMQEADEEEAKKNTLIF